MSHVVHYITALSLSLDAVVVYVFPLGRKTTSHVLLGTVLKEIFRLSPCCLLMLMPADGSHRDPGRTAEEPAVTKTLRFGRRTEWGD